MKSKLLLLLCSTQLIISCSKTGGGSGGGTPTPTASSKGYIRVTFSGKTLEARDTTTMKGTVAEMFNPMQLGLTINTAGSGGYFNKIITLNSIAAPVYEVGTLKMYCGAFSDSSKTNSPLDTYNFKYYNTTANTVKDLTTSIVYPIDTPSTVTVTYSDANYTEGTMKLSLQGSGGSKIPATGSFKVYHK